jgi:hypothetical protein
MEVRAMLRATRSQLIHLQMEQRRTGLRRSTLGEKAELHQW